MTHLRCIVLVDDESIPADNLQLETPAPEIITEVEYHIMEHLRLHGHEANVLPLSHDLSESMAAIQSYAPDLVVNLTEHFRGLRHLDSHVAAMLEMLGVRFTGASSVGMALCRDKALCKRILGYHRIRVPDFFTVDPGPIRISRKIRYPQVVKPALEDGSDGISLASVVQTLEELTTRIRMIHDTMNQPVICEQYIRGRELYASVLGERRLTVLPPRELFFPEDQDAPNIATRRIKQDEDYRQKWNIRYDRSNLDPKLQKRIERVSRTVYRALQLRDYGRIDLRITEEGHVYVLEANANPDLTDGDEVACSAAHAGISYSQMIQKIFRCALRRTGDSSQR